LPRAVAPPVGDIAIGSINTAPTLIDLGTAVRVPRLVLREAPVREVLALLARSAGLNLAFTGGGAAGDPAGQAGQPGAPPAPGQPGQPGQGGPTITLDIENESVQDVFNYVLQISGLQANRVGRTIFVGAQLPVGARNVVSRSLRLNQVSASAAANFLTAQGAETQVPIEQVQIQTVGEGAAARTIETRTPSILALRPETTTGTLLLRGLSVIPDARLNAVTLIGEPRQVEIASSLLTQLDLRRRQVAVNVRIVDVNLTATDNFNTSFRFGVGDVFINFAPGRTPAFGTATGAGGNVRINPPGNVNNDFVANLLAQIENNNAKILTDPTLVIQEGQTAQVNLTQEIIGNIERTTTVTENVADITVTAEKEEVGVILNVNVDRIDDNGFVTLRVIPQVTSIAQNVPLVAGGGDENAITLRNIRQLDSGLVRLRDNQTLILTGIIQDQNITQSAKVPFLGDIPILGALFRSTQRVNQRSEVIVLLTPQIIDDSQNASFGYNYTPSPDAREVLERRNFPSPEGR
jgi:type IV pilus assembly protein PilQ